MSSPIEALRSCKYLCLHSVVEPEEGGVRVVVLEAIVGQPPDQATLSAEPLPEVRNILSQSRAIVHSHGRKGFAINWPTYIGYSVENESYAVAEPESSVGSGGILAEYSHSLYLDYLSKATFARQDYPGPFKHWSIACLDHVINVVSVDLPAVEVHNGA